MNERVVQVTVRRSRTIEVDGVTMVVSSRPEMRKIVLVKPEPTRVPSRETILPERSERREERPAPGYLGLRRHVNRKKGKKRRR